jgi:hypothetical protein
MPFKCIAAAVAATARNNKANAEHLHDKQHTAGRRTRAARDKGSEHPVLFFVSSYFIFSIYNEAYFVLLLLLRDERATNH